MSLDEAVRVANVALPGAFISSINIPNGSPDLVVAQMKFPEDRTPSGRSRVFIDPYSGRVELIEDTRKAQLGTWIQNQKRSLHTGDVFGLPSRLIWFAASLILVAQVITGMIMWWKPRKPRPVAAAVAAVEKAPAVPATPPETTTPEKP